MALKQFDCSKIPPASAAFLQLRQLCQCHATDIAAVTCGRDMLSSSAHPLLDTLVKLPPVMKPGVFPKLKVYVSGTHDRHVAQSSTFP